MKNLSYADLDKLFEEIKTFNLKPVALRAIFFWNIGIFKRTMAASIPATSAAF